MFSQHDEEKCILENTPQRGHLVDIGAWNAVTFSNSRALIERGWMAVLVEPSPIPFAGLIEAYKDNENVVLVNALIGGTWTLRQLFSSADAISTTSITNTAKWGGVKNFSKIIVPQIPVSEVINTKLDFISIDTEGSSVDILKDINLSASTDLVCVEHDGRYAEVENHFKQHKFVTIYKNNTNMIGKRA